MELATDIMAILGFIGFGRVFPVLTVYLGGGEKTTNKQRGWICALSFGIIASSIVLG
jgi:hypothetical protein